MTVVVHVQLSLLNQFMGTNWKALSLSTGPLSSDICVCLTIRWFYSHLLSY